MISAANWINDVFRARVRFLRESELWDRERLKQFQLLELQRIIAYSHKNVPYYRKEWALRGLSADSIKTLDDIRRFPMIDKSVIQSRAEEFIADGFDSSTLFNRSTGGSTGTPLTVYMDLDHISRDKANTEYYMQVAGLNIFDYRSVRLYGDKIKDELIKIGEYWQEVDDRKLIMSCYHISNETVSAYVSKLKEFRPTYIHSRPSAIYPLARAIHETGLKIGCELKGVFLDGEVLPAAQRQLIESVFCTRVFMIYGHTEGCAVGVACSKSSFLHFMPQVGLLEVVGGSGEWLSQQGDRGEMVVTGFNNLVYPLIRYRTYDVGVKGPKECPCGRGYDLLQEVEGRSQDYAVSKLGAMVPVAPAVFNYNDMDWKGIRQFKAQQHEKGKLLFKICREPNTVESQELMRVRVLQSLSQIFGGAFDLEVEYTQDFDRTPIGKFRYLEQHLDMKVYQ